MSTIHLPRAAPSAYGVDAARVLTFLDAVDAAGLDLHSLLLMRRGHVVTEGWWAPYRADQVQLLYSLSKSFTSIAIGIAVGEGLLSLDDQVATFFPDKAPDSPPPSVTALRVRHLLAMSSGHATDTAQALRAGGPDMVRTFLSIPPDREPGTLFCYNQGCTYTLSAILQTLTGQRLLDYLRPRLLDPLGIEEATWLRSEDGVDLGFSGLHVATESIAKLGQLFLQNGWWDGQQLVPEAYIEQARSRQIDNSAWSENPDWQQGYGFQLWLCRSGAYRGDGAFGQFCVVLPQADAVIACTAQVAAMQAQANLFWDHLRPALSGEARPDAAADDRLSQRLRTLSTPLVGDSYGSSASVGSAVSFAPAGELPRHLEGLSAVRVEPAVDGARMTVALNGAEHALDVRPGSWAEGELPSVGRLLPPVAVTGGWMSAEQFAADIVFLASPHRLRLRAHTEPVPTIAVDWAIPPM